MASLSKLVAEIARITGEPVGRVRQIARNLQEHGEIPTSVGRRVARVHPEHAVSLLFGMYAADKIADVSSAAATYFDLPIFGKHVPPGFPNWARRKIESEIVTAGQVVTQILAEAIDDEHRRLATTRIAICVSWPQVDIQDSSSEEFEAADVCFVEAGQDYKHWHSMKPMKTVTIPGNVLTLLAAFFRNDDDE